MILDGLGPQEEWQEERLQETRSEESFILSLSFDAIWIELWWTGLEELLADFEPESLFLKTQPSIKLFQLLPTDKRLNDWLTWSQELPSKDSSSGLGSL